ncbi:MAG: phosphate ABC transporter, permease protein PstA [Asticcacaulis sp.]|nr:phosphate ABC transporter, permease protein PstA [Asticcacaulis sp.]
MAITTSARAARRKAANYVFIGLCMLGTAIALLSLALILGSLVSQGIGGLNLNIFTMDTPAAGSEGGLRNAIVGSLLMCGVGMLIAIVVGVLAGTWLAEIGGDTPYGHMVRFLNDVLLSAPSILIGLFVYQILVSGSPFALGHFSGWAGAVALAILAIWKAAGAGLLSGGLLGFARISGETAPLLFTALGNQFFNANLNEAMESLPHTMFNFALTPYDDLKKLAWVAALLVASAVLGINILGRWLARDKSGH